jgi:GTPase involved in cell partitioning and DNA repair
MKMLKKEEDNRNLSKELLDQRERVNHAQAEVDALKLVVSELEQKNRRLSDRLNEIIFNKASVYKQKTIEQLNRAGQR